MRVRVRRLESRAILSDPPEDEGESNEDAFFCHFPQRLKIEMTKYLKKKNQRNQIVVHDKGVTITDA